MADHQLNRPLRFGAVNYLNSKPLIEGFGRLAGRYGLGEASLLCDLPSRLADSLAAGRLDVALVPTFEALAEPGWRVVSTACVAADGPVDSVKLYFRTPPQQVRTLALDEGSRTSAALSQLMLAQRFGLTPQRTPLPIGEGLADATADAVLMIGDRAMHPPTESSQAALYDVWDLAQQWRQDTGLPFVFAVWAAREPVDTQGVNELLDACRDEGIRQVSSIARAHGPPLGLNADRAERYLRENLRFYLHERELAGLEKFRQLCTQAGLLPTPATAP